MRILIVEDEVRIREGLKKLIGKLGDSYEVIGEAENGQEGLTLILKMHPDLVITDIRMPMKDGLEMLKEATASGLGFRAIVLSAYTEFDYAREAIKLGVTEYLIKPIVLADLSQALQSVEIQQEQASLVGSMSLGRLENIVTGLLYGNVQLDDSLMGFVNANYSISEESLMAEAIVYLGDTYDSECDRTLRNLERVIDKKKGVQCCLVPIKSDRTIVIIFFNHSDDKALERWFRTEFFLTNNVLLPRKACGAWGTLSGLHQIKERHQQLMRYMDWHISLGNEVLISYPNITQIQAIPCIYPIDIENDMKVALCADNKDKIIALVDAFSNYFIGGNVYDPKEVKECFVRFIWSSMNILTGLGIKFTESDEQQKMLEAIMVSKTYEELLVILNKLTLWNENNDLNVNASASYTVTKAKNLIHEFYQTGITLDEIAGMLGVTPEYLGTQFHKDMGVNFSQYIRTVRMKKAKKLLLGTPLKLYEIAKQVGYADPKYFSRVFKDVEGMLPKQYRQLNK